MLQLSLPRFLLPALTLALLTGCSPHARPESQALAAAASVPTVIAKGKMLRILPLGDSITRGSGSGYGNYRRPLQSLLTKGGYIYQFVGVNTEQSQNYHGTDPEQTFSPYQPGHEGYGGIRIEQISGDGPATDDGGVTYPGLSKTLATDKPDVVLLMLGTNDVNQAFDPGGPGYGGGTGFAADAAGRLDTLVTRLYEGHPALTLVVATITPLADSAKDTQVRAYNALIPQIVAAHQKRGQNALLADQYAGLTASDLSPDGVHPGTIGYDKMARVWYGALTGQTSPPLPEGTAKHGPGRLNETNVFRPADTVTVSNTFANTVFSGANLTDGTNEAFVFGDAHAERVCITGFKSAIQRLRFFDTPSYTGRTPAQVTVYASPSHKTSLSPGDYTKIGIYSLTIIGDGYENPTVPPTHPNAGDPAVHTDAVIRCTDLDNLPIPAGTQSLLLDFSKSGGDGDGLTEIQAFAAPQK